MHTAAIDDDVPVDLEHQPGEIDNSLHELGSFGTLAYDGMEHRLIVAIHLARYPQREHASKHAGAQHQRQDQGDDGDGH